MRGGWIVVVGLVGACTAPNPAFGDADDGTGSTSNADDTTAKPTTDPTHDPTRPSSTSDDDTSTPTESSGMGPGTQMTSDDAGTDEDTSTPTTSTEEGSSDVSTGNLPEEVMLYVAAISNGAFAGDGAGTAIQAGAAICSDAMENLGFESCGGTYQALVRSGPMPFSSPELIANVGRAVVSVEGEAIAVTLGDFLEGDWLVPGLTVIAAGGFDELQNSPLATGGSSADNDLNCEGWTLEDGDMTIGDVDGGGGWFSAGEIACSSPASILCLCLP